MGEKVIGDKVIIVSADSHAGMPKELWSEYLDPKFHDLLPQLRADNELYPTAISLLMAKGGVTAGHPEHAEAHSTGWYGLYDPVLRMADMDREGITAELIYHGDSRMGDLFHNGTNKAYPLEAWEAGAKAWNRWASDAFGFAMERFLVTAAIGPCTDIDAAVAEIHWIADHKFTATYAPGYLTHPGLRSLDDPYWDPFWAACAERNITVIAHAGYGTAQGSVFPQLQKIYDDVARAAGSTDPEAMKKAARESGVDEASRQFFTDFLNHNVDSRRPLWQLCFGGVFDRHPDLQFMPSEIRLDWLPATLDFLDKVYEENRADLPARRKPSEYWFAHCMSGASFIHKAEVEMRHEIGIETIAFGRDYPHPESTWPHTADWLRDAFRGVPDDEVRQMLGENLIRYFKLDRDRLAEIAKRIGPDISDINGGGDVAPELIDNFAMRGGYLKPAEGGDKLPQVEQEMQTDLDRLVAAN